MPPLTLDSSTLVPAGVAASIIVTLVGCTWIIAFKARGIIDSTKNLTTSVKSLSESLDNHVTASDTRDKDNQKEHAALSRVDEAQGQAIKGIDRRIDEVIIPRMDRLERSGDACDKRGQALDRRVAVLEATDAG